MPQPAPLPTGTLLADRFEVEEVLGRGGFGITYRARDLERHDTCVVKELAPAGSIREEDGVIRLEEGDDAKSQRLRQQFLQEARLLARVGSRGVLPIRATFDGFATGYYVTDYVPNARTLEEVIRDEGKLDSHAAMDIVFQVLEILDVIHSRGVLHRDIKPSNILLDEKGRVFLIDFGSAREWHESITGRHTVEFTPGFAPIEQMSERARRGPATDIYALCATAYALLTGKPPVAATDRAAGVALMPLLSVRPDIERTVAEAIEAGLEPRFERRPQSISELRELLTPFEAEDSVQPRYQQLDAKLVELRSLKISRRQCPSCGEVLTEPQPLGIGVCPVCNQGKLAKRVVNERVCPHCTVGVLHKFSNDRPLRICPKCRLGVLEQHGFGLLSGKKKLSCPRCAEEFVSEKEQITHSASETTRTATEWRMASGRSAEVWICDGCKAQFDRLADGRLAKMFPEPKAGEWKAMLQHEWANVAAGYEPSAGNVQCPECHADFFGDNEHVTPLSAPRDPHMFMKNWQGQRLTVEEARWLGAGKHSGVPGLLCQSCQTEFDYEDGELSLVRSTNRQLRPLIGVVESFENWHRIARNLPLVGLEKALEDELYDSLVQAYGEGQLSFDPKRAELLWVGQAEIEEDPADWTKGLTSGRLTVTPASVELSTLLRKARLGSEFIAAFESDGDRLIICHEEFEPTTLLLTPVEFEIRLDSGRHMIELTADSLAILFNRLRLANKLPRAEV